MQSIKQILVLPTINVCQSTVLSHECLQVQINQRSQLHVVLFTNTCSSCPIRHELAELELDPACRAMRFFIRRILKTDTLTGTETPVV